MRRRDLIREVGKSTGLTQIFVRYVLDNIYMAAWGSIIGCIVYTVGVLLHAEVLGVLFCLPDNRQIVVWPYPGWSLFAASLGVFLSLASYFAIRIASTDNREQSGKLRVLNVLSPLSFLPFSVCGVFLRPFIPQVIAGNILFFSPVFILSLVVFRVFQFHTLKLNEPPRPKGWGILKGKESSYSSTPQAAGNSNLKLGLKTVLSVVLVVTLFYTFVGWYFTQSVGAHSGDEGHYLMQAESLYYDHDLDVRNDLSYLDDSWSSRARHHISGFSRDGHWYSWHPFGLSLLLAPFVPMGVLIRHLILGLISGLGCGGLIILCRHFRAQTGWSLLVITLFCFSTFWGVYSSRCLPEVLGATLSIGLLVAIFQQMTRRWSSVFLGFFCCAFLPWVQTRFVPVSLLGCVAYGIVCLSKKGAWKDKIAQMFVFGLLCGGGYLAYYYVYSHMFVGAVSYPIKRLLFSYPLGAWLVLSSNRGLLYVLPMFSWLLGATVWVWCKDRENRLETTIMLLLFLSVLATSCMTGWFTGGACLPGRFLLVVVPLMLAPAACSLHRIGPIARWWLIFLGLISCTQFFLMLIYLPFFGNAFANPPGTLPIILPLLSGLLKPLFWRENLSYLFGILIFAGTTFLIFLGKDKTRLQVMLVIAIMLGAVSSHVRHDDEFICREKNEHILYSPLYRNSAEIYYFVERGPIDDADSWMIGNLPPKSRIAVEDYCLKPGQKSFTYEIYRTLSERGEEVDDLIERGIDFVVTSSLAHNHFFQSPGIYPNEVSFYQELENNYPLLKEFDLRGKPDSSPVIRIYALCYGKKSEKDKPRVPCQFLPSVRETSPCERVYLDKRCFEKDLLTLRVRGKARMTRLLVTAEELEEIVCFNLAAWEKSGITISAGPGESRNMEVCPGTFTYVKLHPKCCFPFTGRHYSVIVRSRERSDCLIKIATEPREIGYTFFVMRDWQQAIVYLERAVEKDADDWESHCLLATAYSLLGKMNHAYEIFSLVRKSAPWYLNEINNMASTVHLIGPENQLQAIPPVGSAVSLTLVSSLCTRYFETEELSNCYFRESERTGDYLFHSAVESGSDVFLYGPYYSLPPGRYQAVFRLRAERAGSLKPVLRLEVTADQGRRVLAAREITYQKLLPVSSFRDISLSFLNDSWENQLEFRARALAPVDVFFDWIAVCPEVDNLLIDRAREILLASARAANGIGEHEEAISCLRQICGEFCSSPEYQYELAIACAALRDYQAAIRAFENVLAAIHGHRKALEQLCQIYRRIGKSEQAVKIEKDIQEKFTPAKSIPPVVFGEKLRLYGYDLSQRRVPAGGEIELKLYFESLSVMEAGLYLFVHFRQENEFFTADQNLGSFAWKRGDVRAVIATGIVPPDFLQGKTKIVVGVWHPALGKRLAASGGGKEFIDSEVEIDYITVLTPGVLSQ